MKTKHLILAAALLCSACGAHHETHCLDTTLMQTDDSVSFDVCFEIRWRNLMAVWVDSTGTLSLTHDFRNTPPPPPPPGGTYEYVEDRVPTDLGQLRDSLSQKLFGLHYGDLALDQAAAIRAAIPTSVYYSTINRYCKIVCYDE